MAQEQAQEKQTNCPHCNKPIKKIRRYYRDGKHYCTKRCWKEFKNKAAAETKA
jgi:endogenous inhibitor of DNA gyrase (YacG/DUF329 family)